MARVEIPYEPRDVQWELHKAIDDGVLHTMLVWHRRAGKTVANVNQLIKSAVTCAKPQPRFAYIAPFYRQAKTLAWDYLQLYSRPIPGVEVNKSELSIDYPNGARVQLFGADNPDALRGIYLDGVVLDEYGQIHPSLRREVLIPALADRGGWEVICGTPKGRNAFYRLYAGDDEYAGAVNDPSWRVLLRKASETGILPRHVLDAALREMGPDVYAQEFECAWNAADKGSYYARIMERLREQRRFGRDIYDRGLAVHTAWDLGIGDANAIWFLQKLGAEVRWVDFYEGEGLELAHYVSVVQKKAQERGFSYGDHWVPHDADHRSLQTGKTLVQMAASMGLKMRVVPVGDLNAGIEATRQVLERSWFDEERCRPGIAALDAYHRKWLPRLAQFADTAEHDWASHAADAARTFATAELGGKLSPRMVGVKRPTFAKM